MEEPKSGISTRTHRDMLSSLRRKSILFGCFLFFVGIVLGVLAGMFGVRYILHRFPPDLEKMARQSANRIQKDFALSDAARERVIAESRRHFGEVHQEFEATHQRLEEIFHRHIDNISDLLEDPAAKAKWQLTYKNYFPRGPRPPPPPPPLD